MMTFIEKFFKEWNLFGEYLVNRKTQTQKNLENGVETVGAVKKSKVDKLREAGGL
jgi:hypothetical protein